MSKAEKKSTALALIQDKDVGAAIPLTKLQLVVVQQFQRIARDTKEAPLRAILLGLTLHRVKASMPHGTFEAWKKANITAGNIWTERTALKNCSFYMRLALAAVEATDATKPQLLALPGDQTELALCEDDNVRAFMASLEDYVGERTIEEILRDEGIKDGAAKKRKALKSGKGDASPAATPAAGQALCNEIAEHLQALRITLTDDAALMQIPPPQLQDIKDSLTQLQQEFSAKVRTALGKKK